jgi:peptide/nickel transport system permease protein
MRSYVLRRILHLIPVLFGVATLTFLLLHITPGDPALLLAGGDATGEVVAVIRHRLGLDQPFHIQYARWMGNVLRGDLGTSLFDDRPVMATILGHLAPTVLLLVLSLTVALVVAIPIGVASAARRNSWVDNLSRLVALLGVSIPSFWLALILILVFAYSLRLVPVAGYGTPAHLVLPVLTLAAALTAPLIRLTRSSLLETLREDFVRTARAKGLGERRVFYIHALRNALLPIVTIIGLQMAALFGGTVIVESVFALPGMGRLTFIRMTQRDYPMILGNLLIYSLLLSLINLLIDLAYGLIDPRIRYD